jgi:hypothetical protein
MAMPPSRGIFLFRSMTTGVFATRSERLQRAAADAWRRPRPVRFQKESGLGLGDGGPTPICTSPAAGFTDHQNGFNLVYS